MREERRGGGGGGKGKRLNSNNYSIYFKLKMRRDVHVCIYIHYNIICTSIYVYIYDDRYIVYFMIILLRYAYTAFLTLKLIVNRKCDLDIFSPFTHSCI